MQPLLSMNRLKSVGLEHPQFTRPADLNGVGVPEILRSGDHAKIKQWREQAALALTKRYRPD